MAVPRALRVPFAQDLPTLSIRLHQLGWVTGVLGGSRSPTLRRRAITDARRVLAAVPSWRAPSWRAPSSIGSYRSVTSIFSAGSLFSVGSFLSVGSVGSILSVGSAGSILSIGSSGSILSIGAAGGFAQVGSRREHDQEDGEDAPLRLAAPAPVRSIRPT